MPRSLEHDWFSHPLPDNVVVGNRSWIYSSFAFCHCRSQESAGIRIGSDTGVYHGTFFDLGPDASIEIGDYCSLVGAIFATNGRIAVGDYTFIAHEVVIADSPWTVPSPNRRQQSGDAQAAAPRIEISIGRNVWIGAQSTLLGTLKIGDGAIIGAGTLVTGDVPSNVVCAGNPMRIVKSI